MWDGPKKLWEGWKRFAHALGNFQARILLTVIYSLIVLPFGLAVRFLSDSLRTKKRPTEWLDYPPTSTGIEGARRQG